MVMAARDCIVVLMAGKGQRFVSAGFVDRPKWMLVPPWSDRTLLDLSIRDLTLSLSSAGICFDICFVVRASDLHRYPVDGALGFKIFGKAKTIALTEVKNGPLDSLHSAWNELRGYSRLFIHVCDTFVPALNIKAVPNSEDSAGVVYCFDFDRSNLCHVDLDIKTNSVARLREKVGPLNVLSSTGLFQLDALPDFQTAMESTLLRPPPRESGEYYVSDAINQMILSGAKFSAVAIPGAYPLGTPEEMNGTPPSYLKKAVDSRYA